MPSVLRHTGMRLGSFALGVVSGIAMWFFTMFCLMLLGFSFYAVPLSVYVALAVGLVAAPLVFVRVKRTRSQLLPCSTPLLLGLVVFLVYGCASLSLA